MRGSVAAVSVGLLDGAELLDLDYREDKDADVDLNLVMTGAGDFIEVQAGGEEATFRRDQLDRLLNLGKLGVDAVTAPPTAGSRPEMASGLRLWLAILGVGAGVPGPATVGPCRRTIAPKAASSRWSR